MSQTKKFICPLTRYYIEFTINETTAELSNISCDFKNMKAFLLLIRNSIDGLTSLKIEYIVQQVAMSEWESFLKDKTTWSIICKTNDIVVLKCKTDDFLTNFGIGIGLTDEKN